MKLKNWVKWVVLATIVAVFTAVTYITLKQLGITSIEGLRAVISSCGVWGWLVFILLQILVTTLLCFVPATSMTFIVFSVILFGAWKGFAISASAVILSSMSMFLIGRFGGEKLAIKMVGEESLKKAQDLIAVKSKIYLPLMFLFPAFPDDALCLVAGITKMRWWEFLLITLTCRTVGVATTCFLGSDLINWSALTIVDWFVFISVCVIDLYIVYRLADKLEKKIKEKKDKERQE